MNVILSIDQSTSATKGLVWSLDGKLLSRADIPHKQITNNLGWIEHDGMEILENTYKAAKDALEKAKINPNQVAVIGLSNQRETAICWDKKSGKPLYNAIVWQCGRASEISNEIKNKGMESYIKNSTGLTLSPFFSAAKFAWMVKNVQKVADAKAKGTLCCGTIDSWLVFKLTGNFKTDYSNASRTQLMNLEKLEWDNELINAFSLEKNTLPEISMSDSFFGKTDFNKLLPTPIPIHGVMGDSHGALFANECWQPYTAKATYGTGSSVMMNAGTICPSPTTGVVAGVAWGMNNTIEYVLEGNINYTGAVIRWLEEDIELLESAKSAGIIAKSVSNTGGVYLVPAFTGLGAPYFNNKTRAAFLGMNTTTKKAHLIRAAEESIAYQIKDVVEIINNSTNNPLKVLHADGGPTRDDFLMNFQASILNIPVEVSKTEELSGMGAAFCAAIGLGIANRNALKQKRKRIEPSMDNATREKLYKGWKEAIFTLNNTDRRPS